jgi:hypothetical protein
MLRSRREKIYRVDTSSLRPTPLPARPLRPGRHRTPHLSPSLFPALNSAGSTPIHQRTCPRGRTSPRPRRHGPRPTHRLRIPYPLGSLAGSNSIPRLGSCSLARSRLLPAPSPARFSPHHPATRRRPPHRRLSRRAATLLRCPAARAARARTHATRSEPTRRHRSPTSVHRSLALLLQGNPTFSTMLAVIASPRRTWTPFVSPL